MALREKAETVIVDPLGKQIMAAIIAAEALAGMDDYCSDYLQG